MLSLFVFAFAFVTEFGGIVVCLHFVGLHDVRFRGAAVFATYCFGCIHVLVCDFSFCGHSLPSVVFYACACGGATLKIAFVFVVYAMIGVLKPFYGSTRR